MWLVRVRRKRASVLEITILPNQRRPECGHRPVSEARRPWLPQHSRLCPVLEAGSSLGYLVFPPLADGESYQVRYLTGNTYRFSFFVADEQGQPGLVFAMQSTPSAGGAGLLADDLLYHDPQYGIAEHHIRPLKDALLVNMDTPPGGVGLRGAFDFRTPDGWDTVFTGPLNQPQPPHIPVLSVRIQTDWYAHNTEFRYILQPGDVVAASGSTPIGQVFFVPRDQPALRVGTPEDLDEFRAAQRRYWEEKATDQQRAPYGGAYSPHYRRVSQPTRSSVRQAPDGR